jgi:hypothetical protein
MWGDDRMELQEALAVLAKIVRDDTAKEAARVNATNTIAKMLGWNAPKQLELNLTEEKLRAFEDALLR